MDQNKATLDDGMIADLKKANHFQQRKKSARPAYSSRNGQRNAILASNTCNTLSRPKVGNLQAMLLDSVMPRHRPNIPRKI